MNLEQAANLEQLYNRYKNQIYTLCLHLARDNDFAGELFSETWVRVTEKFYQIKSEYNILNWIYTICLNIYRKKQRKINILSFFGENDDFSNIKNENKNAEEIFIENETKSLLHKNINKLSDKYRIPLILFYFKELSYQQIAQTMKIPTSTVKFRLNQAKNILRQKMEN